MLTTSFSFRFHVNDCVLLFSLLLVLFVWFLLMTCLVLVYDLIMTEIVLFSQQPEDEADLLDQDAMEPGLL